MRTPLGALAAALLLFPPRHPPAPRGSRWPVRSSGPCASNLSLERARRELPAADAQRKAMFAALLPNVAALGNLGLNSTEVSFGEPPNESLVLPKHDWDFRVVATQPFFAGLARSARTTSRSWRSRSARETGRGAEEDVLLAVASAFAAAAGSEALVEVETRNVELVARRSRQAKTSSKPERRPASTSSGPRPTGGRPRSRLVSARQYLEEALGRLRVALVLDRPIDVDANRPSSSAGPGERPRRRRPCPPRREAGRAGPLDRHARGEEAVGRLPPRTLRRGGVRETEAGLPGRRVRLRSPPLRRPRLPRRRDDRPGGRGPRARDAGPAHRGGAPARRDGRGPGRPHGHRGGPGEDEARRRTARCRPGRLRPDLRPVQSAPDDPRRPVRPETSLAEARRGRIAARLGLFLAEVRTFHAAGILAPSTRKEIAR